MSAPVSAPLPRSPRERELVGRIVDAFETADVERVVALSLLVATGLSVLTCTLIRTADIERISPVAITGPCTWPPRCPAFILVWAGHNGPVAPRHPFAHRLRPEYRPTRVAARRSPRYGATHDRRARQSEPRLTAARRAFSLTSLSLSVMPPVGVARCRPSARCGGTGLEAVVGRGIRRCCERERPPSARSRLIGAVGWAAGCRKRACLAAIARP